MNRIIVAVLLAAPMMASAADGEVCIANAAQTKAEPMLHNAVTNKTEFECLTAGTGTTIPELYKKGWKVASVFPQMIQDPSSGLQRTRWTIVIEQF